MKRVLKILGIVLAVFLLLVLVAGIITHKSKPESQKGEKAKALVAKMNLATNKTAYDTTRFVQWSFPRGHHFFWDKSNNHVEVRWADNRVLLDTKKVDGLAFANGTLTEGEQKKKLIDKAWSLFCNDSFWLAAHYKINDPGVTHGYVDLDGYDGLMIEYSSGGVTPGDSYLWKLDKDGLPISYQMWVSIIPIGGLEFTWEEWTTTNSGAKFALNHVGPFKIPLTNFKSGQTFEELGISPDLFKDL